MEANEIILYLLGIGCASLGWFSRQIWTAVGDLKSEVNEVRILIGTDYVRYDRLQDAMKPIMDSLQEIKAALARKADKP